jgi:hypothetical protein
MNTLFDRYFLVLAGRLTREHWGTIATPVQVGSGVITLDWPLEDLSSGAAEPLAVARQAAVKDK